MLLRDALKEIIRISESPGRPTAKLAAIREVAIKAKKSIRRPDRHAGRPRVIDYAKAIELRDAGETYASIAQKLGCTTDGAMKAVKKEKSSRARKPRKLFD